MSDITVVVPTIPVRVEMLSRALASIAAQVEPPAATIVESDYDRTGAAATRQRGLEQVTTPWVAFLDDDDEFKPIHLAALRVAADLHEADYVYSWYEVVGGLDPMPQFFGKPWDNEQPHQTTITTLVKTELAQQIGFHTGPTTDPNGGGAVVGGEDYRFTLGCMEAGAKIYHLPNKTWLWHHHGKNTSGLPGRW